MELVPDFTDASVWISLLTLCFLEVVLGIDNIIFISIVAGKLPESMQRKVRTIGLLLAMVFRISLLFAITWLTRLTFPVITIPVIKGFIHRPLALSYNNLILIAGGLFLIVKSVLEIHQKLKKDATEKTPVQRPSGFAATVVQIVLIDAVFSFDSIITAGGTAKHVEIMIAAVVIAMTIMFLFSPKISAFIHKHPTLKMLALSFLVMIGISLIIEGWDSEAAHQLHLKNYIYFGMAFSFGVEMLNMTMMSRAKKKRARLVELNEPIIRKEEKDESDMAK